MNILVIRMSAMGDVAMTVPVVSAFAQQHPEARVTVLTNPRFGGMFPTQANVEVFGADTKKDYKGFWGIFRLFKVLRGHRHYDMVIDLHDVLRSKVLRTLFRLVGKPVHVIQKGRAEKKALVRIENKEMRQLKSSIDRYRDTFRSAGFEVTLNFARPTTALTDEATAVTGEKRGRWIAVAPFAQHKGKIYPTENMERVVEHFSKKQNLTILLFGGGKQERDVLEDWANRYENVVSLAGKLPLEKELSVIEHADLLVSMDSSNMHLASLVGTRVLSIWGATHPFAGFYGYGQNEADALQVDLPCRPCSIYGNKPCLRGDYACMTGITPEMIIKRMEGILEETERKDEDYN